METIGAASDNGWVKVWDLPLRLFHWALVLAIAVAFLGAEENSPLNRWHMVAGWVASVLLAFRVVWGFVGGEHSRFVDFIRPRRIGQHVSSLLAGRQTASLGHNPLGGLSVVVLLFLTALVVASGAVGGDAAEGVHEAVAWGLLAVVGVHIAAVILMSVRERENLVRAMITGRKPANRHPEAVDARRARLFAWALAAAMVAGAVFLILRYDPHAFRPRSTEAFEQRAKTPSAARVQPM